MSAPIETPQGRRASWGGPDPLTPDKPSGGPISIRRSLASIFGSLGKAGKQAERQKHMTNQYPHRKVPSLGTSQFYIDLPHNNTQPACPVTLSPNVFHTHIPIRLDNQDNITVSEGSTQRRQHNIDNHTESPASSPRRVLVIPEAAREAKAYLERARLLAEQSEKEAIMGLTSSVAQEAHEEAQEAREDVTVCVTQRYGSVLAELTQRYNTHLSPPPPPPPHLAHILPRRPTAPLTHIHNSYTGTNTTPHTSTNTTPHTFTNTTPHTSTNTTPHTFTNTPSNMYGGKKWAKVKQNNTSESERTSGCNDRKRDTPTDCITKRPPERESSEGECSGDGDDEVVCSGDEIVVCSGDEIVVCSGDEIVVCSGDEVESRGEAEGESGESEGEGESRGVVVVCEGRGNSDPPTTIVTPCDLTNPSDPVNSDLTNPSNGGIDGCSSMGVITCGINSMTLSTSDVTPGASPELTSQEKRDRKIFLIAQEVMTSERVFVGVLQLLNIDFRKYIMEWEMGDKEDSKPALPARDLNRILNYLPQLQNLNEEILSDLEESITDWETRRKISDVIVRKGPFLKLYSSYIQEFQSQCDHLDHCCALYPTFTTALRHFEASEQCNKLSVRHYMLKPVQRIPQYRLLLEQYLKALPQESPDYVDTQDALAVVANVASHANTTLKQGTNFMKLLALQDRLSSNSSSTNEQQQQQQDSTNNNTTTTTTRGPRYELVKPGRNLLKEGELLKLCRREMQPRYFILLSDVLLYTSQVTGGPGGALRLNYELTLEGMRVETPKAEDFKNEFSVISTSRSFTLQASSAEERDEWLRALREAIADNASRRSSFMQAKIPTYPIPTSSTLGKQAPVWIPDYRVTMCQQCTAAFTLTFRRHHCRACGKVVCDHCSANRAPLQYKRNQAARVCDGCFEVLQRDYQRHYEAQGNEADSAQVRDVRPGDPLRGQFKRGVKETGRARSRRKVPDRLMEVCASDASSQMCGYLRVLLRRSWRRGWFVLKDRVLYEYRASQDVKALYSLSVLGYLIQPMDKEVKEVTEDLDNCLAFQLSHPNQPPLLFQADSPHLAEKWIQAMKEAVVWT